jgi:hypothetical protein
VPQDTTGSNDTQSPLPDGAGDTALSPEDSSLPIDADNDTSTADTNPEPPAVPVECTEEWQSALYAQRIEPLVSGEKPSSCNQCHLSGMDLSMYAKGNPCQTMACMIEQGVVDLTAPEESEVLAQIAQADPQSALITKDIVEEEHSGFLEWIQYSALCHEHVCGEQLNACAAEAPPMVIPNDVPDPLGSCSEEALLDQFIEQVFVWRGRCHSCHDNCKPTYPAPCFLVDEFEDTEEGLKSAALITMYNLLGMDAIDPEVPFQSMMLLKPLSLPMGGVAHGGGTKFGDIADPALQDFQLWLESYSACYFGQELQTPIVTVTSPKDKKKYTEGAVIILKASVEDGQGSDFPPESVVWYSNQVSGVLATGLGPHTVVLGLGKHILTVAATDSDWNTGVRSIKIWVKAP